ncbi:hypothetical protein [Mycobacterium sp. 48b]|uniref:hypothetical protein n=1 Tax=Mycobacterium sp. 48b TaxID=3400426 RepID=UPI003AAA99C0
MSGIDGLRDGTALGCVGRCKVCGKAIQLRRVREWMVRDGFGMEGAEFDVWCHFTMGRIDESGHPAQLNPGVCDD